MFHVFSSPFWYTYLMQSTTQTYIKKGRELTQKEIDQINIAKDREWKIPPMDISKLLDVVFLLIKDDHDNVFAQGELFEINRIRFHNETFNILGIGGIIANVKGQGYGRMLMQEIEKYITESKKTGVGFTNEPEFYKKCGIQVDCYAKSRFVYISNGKRTTNKEDECILFIDGSDKFMEKVLFKRGDVILPITPDW